MRSIRFDRQAVAKSLFIVLRDVQPGATLERDTTFPALGSSVSIGRHPESDVVLADASVSVRHAELAAGEHGVEVVNLSANGATFVDGDRLEPGGSAVVVDRSFWLQVGRALVEVNVFEQTLQVEEAMEPPSHAPEPTHGEAVIVRVEGGETPLVWIAGKRVPLFPMAARVLIRLCRSAPDVVDKATLFAAMDAGDSSHSGRGNLDQNITYVRNVFVEALESGLLDADVLARQIRNTGVTVGVGASPRELARTVVKNVRGVGFRLALPASSLVVRLVG